MKTYDAQKAGKPAVIGWRSFIQPRTVIYGAVFLGVGILMLTSLLQRVRLDVTVQSDRNPQYVKLSDGNIRNGYTIEILNMEQRPRSFTFKLDGLPACGWSTTAEL